MVIRKLRSCSGVPAWRTPEASGALRAWIYARDGGACLECGTVFNLTLDHIWPAVMGGTEWASNLQTLCQSCNSRRKRAVIEEHGEFFYPPSPFYDERGLVGNGSRR